MSDFNVQISTTNNQLEIESSIINSLNFNEVNNTIETILSETINNVLEIESSINEILEISTEYVGSVIFASDVIGLDNYLSNLNIVNLGNVSTTGTLTVGGNLIINGTTTTVNSTVTTVDDPILTIGGDTAPGSDDNKDRGIEFRYYSGSAKTGFFGYDDSTGKFTFIPDATNTSEVFSGTKGEVDANVDWANILNKPDPVVAVSLTGDVTGSGNVTLTDLASGTVTVSTTIAANSVTLGTGTTGDYVASIANGNFLTGGGAGSEGAALTLGVNAAATGVSNVVARDGSGNFSAGTITATNFSGGGSSLTSLNASNLSSGTVASGLLPNVTVGSTETGPTGSFVSSVSTDAKGRVTNVNTTTHTVATTSVQGIASFGSGDFSVAAGVVTIKASGVGNSQLENDRVTIGLTPLVLGTTVSAISGVSAASPVVLTFFSIDGGTP